MFGSPGDDPNPSSTSSQSTQSSSYPLLQTIKWPSYISTMNFIKFLLLITIGIYASNIFSALVVSRVIMFGWFGVGLCDMIYSIKNDNSTATVNALLAWICGVVWAFLASLHAQ